MKNVTGLDLVKLNCGAWGTLGVLTEVIFKVLPKPARSLSVGLGGMNDTTAIAALTAALGSSFAVSAAAHIPASIGSDSTTIVRLEGSDGSVAYGARELAKLWRSFGRAELIEGDESANLWLRVRDAHWLAQPMDRSIWRLSLAPSKAPHVLADIRQKLGVRYFFDWGGSLVWLAVVDADDAGASVVREAMVNTGGHATLVRASSEIRRRIDVFEPLPPAVLKLTQEIKKSFDPDRVLNFGRMYAGI
jgi:glycolate oxidase FAD binding subunit